MNACTVMKLRGNYARMFNRKQFTVKTNVVNVVHLQQKQFRSTEDAGL